jgi:hypothetical protein
LHRQVRRPVWTEFVQDLPGRHLPEQRWPNRLQPMQHRLLHRRWRDASALRCRLSVRAIAAPSPWFPGSRSWIAEFPLHSLQVPWQLPALHLLSRHLFTRGIHQLPALPRWHLPRPVWRFLVQSLPFHNLPERHRRHLVRGLRSWPVPRLRNYRGHLVGLATQDRGRQPCCQPGSGTDPMMLPPAPNSSRGYHCPNTNCIQYACPAGTYQVPIALTCLRRCRPLPPPPPPLRRISACSLFHYSLGICPAGFFGPVRVQVVPFDAVPGRFRPSWVHQVRLPPPLLPPGQELACLKRTSTTMSPPLSCSCSDGYYAPDRTRQSICPVGHYCPSGCQVLQCPRGTFNPTVRASACTSCPAGSFAAGTASPSCTSCPVGTFQDQYVSVEWAVCSGAEIDRVCRACMIPVALASGFL